MGTNAGIYLLSGSINCTGTPLSPIFIVRYNTVQEQSTTNWEAGSWNGSLQYGPTTSLVTANFRFTEWSVLASDWQIYAGLYGGTAPSLQDCQMYSGTLYGDNQSICSSNCLYDRVTFYLEVLGSYSGSNVFCNNFFWAGQYYVINYASMPWGMARDNLFDQTLVAQYGPVDICSNNAYVTTNFGYLTPTNNLVVLTNSPAYQTGTLGGYYYPFDQTNLIFQGSQLASAAGLYHYTVTTNNTIDGTNMVSIGFHYVACSNGVPLDTTGDGLPDYVKDGNGDGVYDAGDLANWLSPFNIYDAWSNYLGWTPPYARLGYWRFNTNTYQSEAGDLPLQSNDVPPVPDWSGNAVCITNAGSLLSYPATNANGPTFSCGSGTVRFWYMPFSASGVTNPSDSYFILFGNSGGSSWAIAMDSNEGHIDFSTVNGAFRSDVINTSYHILNFQCRPGSRKV